MPSTPLRHAAFMRAINVGKRRVKMAVLAEHVESLGFVDARTLIASGNVAFTDPEGRTAGEVQRTFDEGLTELLGFTVVSALRTAAQIEAVVAADPFGAPGDPWSDWTDADVVHVLFLLDEPPAEAAHRLADLESPEDRLALVGAELFWRRRGRLTDSTIDPGALAKALGADVTARRLDTVAKMVPLLG